MNANIKKLIICFATFSSLAGCTKLDEEMYGSLSPDTYYKTEAEGLSSVAGVYQLLSYNVDINDPWRMGEFMTDEFIVPGRASGGWFDQNNIDLTKHQQDANNATNARAWKYMFQEIGTANAVLESLQKSPNQDAMKPLIAETRALRAYGYFYCMDYWGNIPLVTVARIDPNNLPTNTPRADIYKFIESELLAAVNDIPSVTKVNRTSYYPRFTKESIYSILAILYLNAEVYTGTPQWQKASDMCDKVISSGAYDLETEVLNNFKSNLQANSKEIISAFTVDPVKTAGNNQFILYTQNALDQLKYNLPFAPANGYSTTQAVLDRYENQDVRKTLIEYGPQTYLDGSPLKYANGTQLVLVPVKDIISAQDNEGYKVLKYTPVGTTWSGYNGDNDLVMVRYSEIFLTKAEALFKLGNTTDALTLINKVRTRSKASSLTSLTIQNIEDERSRELLWEGSRRRDMIRFGDFFTGTWAFKTTQTEKYRGLMPIPNEQITANPNLKQNTGYK
ncbi:RagB/SusD family nutrient uptake outer membrane protein [Pinibacter soli]|uniref:RagB/SusD family nutrient uptake outer membrane protein n=1 Tax=Pinibacter soli TaxID=3044211 RepID=A0ABT6RFC1_9BACT|nr:RagB/SusD family nutrient uptake outer membrane protein [Pinibacter soli]MDI3321252.1 RagB/SusD family nutrient uptake outer membrane protein [Pinibacter soli]